MERNFTNEEFEHFLQENADGLRMQPSPRAWENISGQLDRKRRWVRVGFISFACSVALLAFFTVDNAKFEKADALARQKENTPAPALPEKSSARRHPVQSAPAPAAPRSFPMNEPGPTARVIPITAAPSIARRQEISGTDAPETAAVLPGADEPAAASPAETGSALSFTIEPVDEHQPALSLNSPAPALPSLSAEETLPTIESVVNLFRKSRRKLTWQLQVTPTISYRKLSDNKAYLRTTPQQNAPSTIAPLYDINKAVTHKPDMGLEIGMAAKYPLSQKFRLRTGLQFNINRYDIKAFNYVPELATIALNNRYRPEAVKAVSKHRNFGGTRANSNWLQNYYFQVSVPIGVEWKL
ncbi:MAG TPA: hypothetical protein VHK69_21990, partial [Chitinophagaceae bacterium]|nr:hypothetical protein [Chitinophagaceae bacterium]